MRLPLHLILIGIGTGSLLMSFALWALWSDWRGQNVPLHSAMSALGALAAIAMATVLFQRRVEENGARFRTLALGFLGMGILEAFHAILPPGNGFILSRNLAGLLGGAGFVLACVPESDRPWTGRQGTVWALVAGSVALGLWTLAFPDHLPEMMRNGEFSPTAVAPKSLASLFFLGAAARFLVEFRRSGRSDEYFLACLALLFGLAELMFTYSRLWDSVWWFWHLLLLAATLWVLGYLGRSYLQTLSGLRVALAQAQRAEDAAHRSEQQLRRALEARERMAQDLHDGVIQSIYAVGLALERAQRLMTRDSKEAVRQLGASIADLKLVIRDLRGYLVGLEAPISNGRELEAALASLVKTLEGPHHLRVALEVDPLAADQVTPEQAAHLLYIVQEAMSNSLRHSGASTGALSLRLQDGRVRLELQDHGVGFHPQAVKERGHGLRNMAARAQRLGAQLQVLSEPGHGTRVVLDLPKESVHVSQ